MAETTILGVRTNLGYLRWLIEEPAMRDGEMRTDTIDRMASPALPAPDDRAWSAAAAAAASGGLLAGDVWGGGWRANAPSAVRLRHEQEERRVELGASAPDLDRVAVDAQARAVHVEVDGQSLEFAIAGAPTVDEAVRHAATHAEGHAALLAPMPGRVVAVRAAAGASVAAHTTVVVIEAMKMEHAVTTPIAGVVGNLVVREGDQVQRGDLLAEVVASADLESAAVTAVDVRIYEVGPRDGLQAEPTIVADRGQAALHRHAGRCRAARDRDDLARFPEGDPAAGRRGEAAESARPASCRALPGAGAEPARP